MRSRVYIDTASKSEGENVSPTCFSMSVSAAGGAQFRAGSASGGLDPVTVYSYKFGSQVTGTLNDNNDIDTGLQRRDGHSVEHSKDQPSAARRLCSASMSLCAGTARTAAS